MNRISIYPDPPGYSARVVVMNHELIGRGLSQGIALWDLRAKLEDTFRSVQEVRDEINNRSTSL